MKKIIVTTCLLATGFLLTACGESQSSNESQQTTIQFMHSSVEQERLSVINELVADFEKENPDIKIKQVPVEESAFNTKIVTLARSGKLPEAGFSEPENWDDILKIAQHFTDKENKQYGIAMPTAEGTMSEQAFSQFALSNGANVLDDEGEVTIDTEKMREALSFYQNLSQYTMPGSNDVTEIKDAFMNGTAPMAIYSTYILPSVYEAGNSENIGFAIPTQKDQAVYGTVSGLTISSGLDEKQKEAAEAFTAFLSQPKNMEKWVLMSPGGAQPVNKQVVELDGYKENEVIKSFGELPSEIASAFDEVQVFGLVGEKNFTKMGDITSSGVIGKAVNQVTVGNEDVDQALADAQKNTK